MLNEYIRLSELIDNTPTQIDKIAMVRPSAAGASAYEFLGAASAVAKNFVENYTGTSLGGTNRSVASAINGFYDVVAPYYSSSTTYSVGDHIIYDGLIYRCTSSISTPETWNSAHWDEGVKLSEHLQIDASLSSSGKAADAKAVGDELSTLSGRVTTLMHDVSDIPAVAQPFSTSVSYAEGEYCEYGGATYRLIADKTAGAFDPTKVVVVYIANDVWALSQRPSGTGLSNDAKAALMVCFQHVAWADDDGQDYYNALEAALYPPVVSITAAFNQGSAVIYTNDTLDTLRQYLTVTAYYEDNTSGVVTNYTLSGTLTAGTDTITVSYGGKTTTFTVTVTSAPGGYVTDNLLMLLDGEANGASGTHASTITTLVDQSGNGYSWEAMSGTVTATAKALVFDGSSALQDASWSAGMATPGTIEIVADIPSPATTQCILCGFSSETISGTSVGAISVKESNLLRATGGENGCLPISQGLHTYTFVNNNGTWAGYIDGTSTAFGSTTVSWKAGGKRLGAFTGSSGIGIANFFTGSIYSIRMYSDALSASEIAANHSYDMTRFSQS